MNGAQADSPSVQFCRYDSGVAEVERSSYGTANSMAGWNPSVVVPQPPVALSDTRPTELRHPVGLGSLVGQSPAMQELFALIQKLAPSSASVLIAGQSGTGKELVAREIHNLSPRRNGPFIAINTAALPEDLIESELFGHEKGAFTGAVERHLGCFEQAHGGTLFLDEIGEMPRAAQPRLLRVLEDLRVRRLGSRADVSVDVRVLAATSQPAETRLRDDLYYRLSVFQILLPPLRSRAEDIPLIAQVMIQILNRKNGTLVAGLDSEVLRAFETYHWPGNARELRNVIERASIVAGTGMLRLKHLPGTTFGHKPAAPAMGAITLLPGSRLSEIEEAYITLTLQHANHNLPQAAGLLGITPRTLRNRIASFPKATKAATSSG
ncbi:MAG: sigma-54 dependent transcriptional regulator [Acidobacteriia bacterium]|nr:sigma-54 dependent transcriptional regulator [Terriglobia bacterium]